MRERIKLAWQDAKLQMIGAVLLAAAFVCAIWGLVLPAWIMLAAVGVIDLWIIYIEKSTTVSRWIRGFTGHAIDNLIMLGLVAACWWLKGETAALWFLLGLLNCHLFERN